jgi:signal transduction histidine kinase/integral membrane sensor domain MASE1
MTGVRFGTSLTYLAAYVAAFLLGRLVIIPGSGLAMFWPAAGVSALWMLRGRTRDQVTLDALLLFLTTAVINLVFDTEPLPTALWALANLIQGFAVRQVAAWFERRSVTSELLPDVRTARQLLMVGCGALLGALVSAPVSYLASVIRTDIDPWTSTAWITWTVRNACGALVVATAVLAIRGSAREQRARQASLREALAGERRPYVLTELVGAVLVTLTSGILVFSSGQGLPIGFVMLASSAWIGFRFTPVVAGVHTLVFGSLAVLSSLEGWGPFGEVADLNERAIIVQTFVAVTGVITLMLALGVAERGRLLERLRISESQAHARAAMLDGVTEVLSDGLAVIDGRMEVLLSNPAAAAMAGGPAEEDRAVRDARGHGFLNADGSQLAAEELPHLRALRGEMVSPTDFMRIDPVTGATSVLSVSAVPLYLGEEEAPLAVVLIHDATRERAQTRELEAFAGVVAHDLENPLASLMNWSEILDDQLDELTEDASVARGSLVKIYRSADLMQQLIHDLLLLTRTSSSELEMVAISLDEVVDLAARETADQVTAIAPRIEHEPLGTVRADLTLVRQVLNNLIGNAVKYVAPGVQPVVRISATRVGEMLQVQVSDNGIGIPAADRARVFDSWFRSEGSRRLYPGTGLGLSITSRAIERHGGTITARARTDGDGSVFTFTLPLDPEPLLRIAPAPASRGPGPSGNPQRDGRTTSAEPPPRRTGSDTAVS